MAIILLYFEQMVEYYLEFSKNVALENLIFSRSTPQTLPLTPICVHQPPDYPSLLTIGVLV